MSKHRKGGRHSSNSDERREGARGGGRGGGGGDISQKKIERFLGNREEETCLVQPGGVHAGRESSPLHRPEPAVFHKLEKRFRGRVTWVEVLISCDIFLGCSSYENNALYPYLPEEERRNATHSSLPPDIDATSTTTRTRGPETT